MKVNEFIEKAIEGEWKLFQNPSAQKDINNEWVVYLDPKLPVTRKMRIYEILLDPLAWQAVGKVGSFGSSDWQKEMVYRDRMHLFIDALCDGKDLEESLDIATK